MVRLSAPDGHRYRLDVEKVSGARAQFFFAAVKQFGGFNCSELNCPVPAAAAIVMLMGRRAKISRAPAEELADLLNAVATGDRIAFRALYDKAEPVLTRVCSRLARDQELTREALQEAMFRIWQKSHLFDSSKGTALSWMIAVVRNCTFNMIEARTRIPFDEETAQSYGQTASPDVAAAVDITRCLAALSENQRQCIILAYHFGLSYEELSERMAVPVNTVKTRIHRAVRELKLCLER